MKKAKTTAEVIALLADAMEMDSLFGSAKYNVMLALDALEERLRMENAKSVGASVKTKILDKIGDNPSRPGINGAWIDGNGNQCVCDGYRAFRLHRPLPCREMDTSRAKPLDLDKVIGDAWKYTDSEYDSYDLSSIDVPGLRAAFKKAKAQKVYRPLVKCGISYFNPEFLLDLVSIFPSANFQVSKVNSCAAAYASCDEGDSLLLPVRHCGSDDGSVIFDITDCKQAESA